MALQYLDNRGKLFFPVKHKFDFKQCTVSCNNKNVLRGLHFQWNPNMGKLVRTITGYMVDLILDLRQDSPTLGKIMAFHMPSKSMNTSNMWIWVPEGCAHGNFFLEDSYIEYFFHAYILVKLNSKVIRLRP